MLTILTTIFGLVSGVLPSVVKIFERKQEYQHELELIRLKMEAAKQGLEFEAIARAAQADADESKSLRDHDSAITYGGRMETLRASVRPVLTYFFFALFCIIKLAAVTLMFTDGYDAKEILAMVWDTYTVAIFGAIMGFWFGSRAMTRLTDVYVKNQKIYTANPEKK